MHGLRLLLIESEVEERIGLNDEYEEYAIHDYEAPFEISEYTSIDDINEMFSMYEELESADLGDVAGELMSEVWLDAGRIS